MNLKELLVEGNVVEIMYYGEIRMGVVKYKGSGIETYSGRHFIEDYNESLVKVKENQINRIYSPTVDGLKLIWDRKDFVDWSTIATDTRILIRDDEEDEWEKRYFAYFKNDKIYCFDGGTTSWSVDNKDIDVCSWKYAKLAE